ncbi:hypothetical protein ILYODFUR_012193 [Ilyodon furcidens]|uniref:Uncharacterized protein n=1 Tax=Ilyodon furcidens TaxID=33524 RepID=A0ABV0SWP7_9TELE
MHLGFLGISVCITRMLILQMRFFFYLRLTTDITDKDTINVVYIQEPATVILTLRDVDGSVSSVIDGSLWYSDDACSSVSSHDTLPVSPDLSTKGLAQRSQGWSSEFAIPRFFSSTEILLQSGNKNVICTVLGPSHGFQQ